MSAVSIPLSRPYRAAGELDSLEQVLDSEHSHGDGRFTERATERLREITGAADVLLTTSGTHALEMSTRLIGAGPGDEIILPSFTFPSAANAIVFTGATPVFVDLDPATGNLDPNSVQEAIGPRTKAVSIMHYGGMPADVTALECIARDAGVLLLEDNAHGLGVQGPGVRLGGVGVSAAQSFHDTKNIHCGEGGALLINDPTMVLSAEIMREKGTNRSQFLRGQVDKYSWAQIGSSYLPSELNAAVLSCQLAEFDTIQRLRHDIWNRYAAELADWAEGEGVTLMDPPGGLHAAHLFYLLTPTREAQRALLDHLHREGIGAAFHYVPLHTSAAGMLYGRAAGSLDRSDRFSECLVRLPLWPSMSEDEVDRVITAVQAFHVKQLLGPAMTARA